MWSVFIHFFIKNFSTHIEIIYTIIFFQKSEFSLKEFRNLLKINKSLKLVTGKQVGFELSEFRWHLFVDFCACSKGKKRGNVSRASLLQSQEKSCIGAWLIHVMIQYTSGGIKKVIRNDARKLKKSVECTSFDGCIFLLQM